jgi:hypothetical protein
MDGISGIIPNSAFEIPSNILPKTYLTKKGESKIGFILHTIDHNFTNNKWTTKITGQTINLLVSQPSVGTGSLTYNTTFKFPQGAPDSVSTITGSKDIISFISFDSSSLYAALVKNLV